MVHKPEKKLKETDGHTYVIHGFIHTGKATCTYTTTCLYVHRAIRKTHPCTRRHVSIHVRKHMDPRVRRRGMAAVEFHRGQPAEFRREEYQGMQPQTYVDASRRSEEEEGEGF